MSHLRLFQMPLISFLKPFLYAFPPMFVYEIWLPEERRTICPRKLKCQSTWMSRLMAAVKMAFGLVGDYEMRKLKLTRDKCSVICPSGPQEAAIRPEMWVELFCATRREYWTVLFSNFTCVSVPTAEENTKTSRFKEYPTRTCSSRFRVVTGTHARVKKWLLQLLRTYFSTLVNVTNRQYGSYSRYLGRYSSSMFYIKNATCRRFCFRLEITWNWESCLGSEVLTAVVMKCSTFWVINVCSPLKFKLRFGSILPASCWFLAWIILRSWRWRRHVTSKGRLDFSGLHCFLSQNKQLFMFSINLLTVPNELMWLLGAELAGHTFA
jgi:hypothetical protein